jgi:hypothetical protein
MPTIPSLLGSYIDQTYQRLVQVSGSSFADGLGNPISFGGAPFPYTGDAVITGSLTITGSTISTKGFTGSLQGTASWASNALTSSTADNFTIRGNLTVSGSTTIGDATTDSITLNAATMSLGSGNGILNIDSNTLYVDGANNRVGIGTSSPGYKLDVSGSVNLNLNDPLSFLRLQSGAGQKHTYISTAYSNYLLMHNAKYDGNFRYDQNGGSSNMQMNDQGVSIYTSPAGTAGAVIPYTTVLAISSSGNVGINTSLPKYTLDVSGSGNYTNGLTVTGSVYLPSLTNVTQTNVLGINTTTGQLYYQAAGGGIPYIPQPQVYAERNTQNLNSIKNHSHGVSLPSAGTLSPSWSDDRLLLRYESMNLDFLNYNPKYFLFVYKSNRRAFYRQTLNYRTKKQYFHPFNAVRIDGNFTWDGTYTNFSKHNLNDDPHHNYVAGFNQFASEWNVANNTGQYTRLTGFNPLRFYYNSFTDEYGDEFFPMNPVTEYNKGIVTTSRHFKKWPLYLRNNNLAKPRVNLHIKFAIVIQNPADTAKWIVGPFSENVTISPLTGYFDDGVGINKYYYGWRTRIH